MSEHGPHYDILVVGGGQAGLTAAITAAEAGAKVCVVEAAPKSQLALQPLLGFLLY